MESTEIGFGESFRSARDQMGLSKREVAEELKLAWKTIESLESEDFESLPPYVFVRGYVKSYSKLVGLDADRMASKLFPFYKGIQKEDRSSELKKADVVPHYASPTRASILLTGFTLTLIAVVLILAYQTWIDQNGNLSEVSNNDENRTRTEPSDLLTLDESAAPDKSSSKPNREEYYPSVNEFGDIQKIPSESRSGDVSGTDTFDDPLRENRIRESTNSLEIVSREAGKFTLLSEDGKDELEIEFNDDCWFEISDSQQNLLSADLGRSGDIKFFRGTAPFRIKFGYAPGVNIRFNGRNVELAPYTRNNIAVFSLRRRVESAE